MNIIIIIITIIIITIIIITIIITIRLTVTERDEVIVLHKFGSILRQESIILELVRFSPILWIHVHSIVIGHYVCALWNVITS